MIPQGIQTLGYMYNTINQHLNILKKIDFFFNKFLIFVKNPDCMGKMFYFCGGEMAEWSNAAVLKTVVRLPADRGFESLFLRKAQTNPDEIGIFILGQMTVESLLSKGNEVQK